VKKIFSFKKNVVLFGFVSLLNDISSDIIIPLLPLFLKNVLSASFAFIGVIEGIAESTASILKLVSGWLSDRLRHRKPFVVAGYLIANVTRPFIALATKPWHVLTVRFLDRTGKGIRTSARDVLIAESCDIQERGKAFGFQRAMDNAGAVIGPLLASGLLYLFLNNYRKVFWFAVIPGIMAVILALFVQEKKQIVCQEKPFRLSLKDFDARFKKFLLIVFIFTLGNSSDAFLILRSQDAGLIPLTIPLLWAVHNAVKSLASMPGGMLSDRLGRKKIIIAGWTVYAAIYAGFAFCTSAWQVWALFIGYGLYYGLTEGTERALVADLVPPELRGSAYGMYYFALGIGLFPASLILGFLWQKFGPAMAFGTGAGLSLLAAVMMTVLIKENRD